MTKSGGLSPFAIILMALVLAACGDSDKKNPSSRDGGDDDAAMSGSDGGDDGGKSDGGGGGGDATTCAGLCATGGFTLDEEQDFDTVVECLCEGAGDGDGIAQADCNTYCATFGVEPAMSYLSMTTVDNDKCVCDGVDQ